jgi:hypothetical protein
MIFVCVSCARCSHYQQIFRHCSDGQHARNAAQGLRHLLLHVPMLHGHTRVAGGRQRPERERVHVLAVWKHAQRLDCQVGSFLHLHSPFPINLLTCMGLSQAQPFAAGCKREGPNICIRDTVPLGGTHLLHRLQIQEHMHQVCWVSVCVHVCFARLKSVCKTQGRACLHAVFQANAF